MIALESRLYGDGPRQLHVIVWGFPCSIMHDRHRPENMKLTGGVCRTCRANARALRKPATTLDIPAGP